LGSAINQAFFSGIPAAPGGIVGVGKTALVKAVIVADFHLAKPPIP
jgi:hypothetical protein